MTVREQIREAALRNWGHALSVDVFMNEIDPIIDEFVGKDDDISTPMPRNWNQSLRKQYINFRNHLRRSLRSKWGFNTNEIQQELSLDKQPNERNQE